MKTICYSLLTIFLSVLTVTAEEAQAESSHMSIRSAGGTIAHYFVFDSAEGEREGGVLIEKEGRIVATIKGVRPVSFSPTAEILLVAEAVADDDLRHYFLKIGEGQFSRKDERKKYTFGSRYVSKAVWSEDGKFLVLFDAPGISDTPPSVITVAEKLGE